MTPAEEDRVVAKLLEAAAALDTSVETGDAGTVAAYRSLAENRGVPLEVVLRAACRDELRDLIVATSPVRPPVDAVPGVWPVPVDDGLGDCRVIDP